MPESAQARANRIAQEAAELRKRLADEGKIRPMTEQTDEKADADKDDKEGKATS